MKFSTALRQTIRRRLERLGKADILVGIPSFNNDSTISHVIKTVEEGLHLHYPDHRCVVMIADGGSVDDTREESWEVDTSPWNERIVTIYRGVSGKGTAVRAIFEAASMLETRVCALFDSDLRSITPEWISCVLDPIMHDDIDFVAPYYRRYKYDGTITNNIVYNLTRALYGYRVRQPIGGDFAFNLSCINKFIGQDVWETNVARFGIDIWLTTTAMVHKAKIVQANLGVKIHDVKDPAQSLGPMFRQVVSTLLDLMEEHEAVWKTVKGSQPVPIVGKAHDVQPQAFTVNVPKLIEDFKIGYGNYKEIWAKIIAPENWEVIHKLSATAEKEFLFPVETWAKVLYDLSAAYHHWQGNRQTLVGLMTPLYFARIASFVNRSKDMSDERAEQLVEEQAEIFEETKKYLIRRWNEDVRYNT
ncbi:MAG: glycosyltransferase [Calditrichia bacterium]